MNDMNESKAFHPGPVSTGEPAAQPSLSAILWIAWFSVREMARRKRLISLALINLLPVLVVGAIRIWFPGEGITAQMQLAGLSHDTFIPFLIPIAAMAVGIPAIGEQVEDGTIVFMWTRPIKRRAIYLGRLFAAQIVSTVLMSGSLALCFLIMVSEGTSVITFDFLKLYVTTFMIIGLGAFTYSAVFAAMGTFFKKPVLPAILLAFGWENLVTNIPARVQELSLRFHLQNLIDHPPAAPEDLPGILGAGTWLLRHKEIEK
jgi:ABC-2 type transport system permease protein